MGIQTPTITEINLILRRNLGVPESERYLYTDTGRNEEADESIGRKKCMCVGLEYALSQVMGRCEFPIHRSDLLNGLTDFVARFAQFLIETRSLVLCILQFQQTIARVPQISSKLNQSIPCKHVQ